MPKLNSSAGVSSPLSRRQLLAGAAAVTAAATFASSPLRAQPAPSPAAAKNPFTFCLNTSTIRGQKLTLAQEIDLAAKAGFTAMEPWLREIEDYTKAGGDLKDLKKRFSDAGIAVVDIIAFTPWLMGDDEANKKSMEQMKRDMETVAQIGALRIAAPPAGAYKLENFDLKLAGKRYRQVIEIGEQAGVGAVLEFWGSSKTLSRISEAIYVATESRHPKAAILPDVYHLHRGGSGWECLKLVAGSAIPVLHMNDYPDKPLDKLNDSDRLMPGDGIAPLKEILSTLANNGAKTALSLELFSKDYWAMDAAEVLKIGMAKMKAAVEKAM